MRNVRKPELLRSPEADRQELHRCEDHASNAFACLVSYRDTRDEARKMSKGNFVEVFCDTPLDVDCAHAHGARALAVATGVFGIEALRETGAALTVETLDAVDTGWF